MPLLAGFRGCLETPLLEVYWSGSCLWEGESSLPLGPWPRSHWKYGCSCVRSKMILDVRTLDSSPECWDVMSLRNRDLRVEEPGARWFLTNFALEALQIHPEPTQAAVTRGGEGLQGQWDGWTLGFPRTFTQIPGS